MIADEGAVQLGGPGCLSQAITVRPAGGAVRCLIATE